jgi:hypothetical protein
MVSVKVESSPNPPKERQNNQSTSGIVVEVQPAIRTQRPFLDMMGSRVD